MLRNLLYLRGTQLSVRSLLWGEPTGSPVLTPFLMWDATFGSLLWDEPTGSPVLTPFLMWDATFGSLLWDERFWIEVGELV